MEQIEIRNIQAAVSKKDQPYLKLETSLGNMFVWDEEAIEAIKDSGTGTYSVDTVMSGKFNTITVVHKFGAPIEKVGSKSEVPSEFAPRKNNDVFVSMAISYAKDLAVAGKIEVNAIETQTKELVDIYNDLI